ncbi:hypothetical protein PGT21_031983 [Puccinia graminis f. sp. tritici]|uniref:Uncharacterized protein n=1 Tax=Puccinia graminis f. sp. tritici TaxID=56615 RepID=A0A5B0MQF4_PUCGR|nr:hypothetical protein PGT21_031983 [Puccinia graminis f. sp. tritici]
MPPNLPPFKVSLQAMSWETLILPLNLGVTRTSTIVHATTSYWESACPSFMRHGGSPQVNGNFRLLSMIIDSWSGRYFNGVAVLVWAKG